MYMTNVQSNEVKRTERLLFDWVYKYCAIVQFLKSSTITVWLVRRNRFDAVAFCTFSRVCTHARICHIISSSYQITACRLFSILPANSRFVLYFKFLLLLLCSTLLFRSAS